MDHDHGAHDHANHNTPSLLTSTPPDPAGVHSHHGTGDHGMSMAFHAGFSETILFSFWKIDTIGGLIGSMIGIFLMAMLYEGLKVLREYLLQRSLQQDDSSNRHRRLGSKTGLRVPLDQQNVVDGGDTPDGSTMSENTNTLLRPHPFSISHALQTFLHMFQAFVSYLLMLVFMTYNVWLGLAVILGAGAGFFVFGWRKRTVVDFNEHCH